MIDKLAETGRRIFCIRPETDQERANVLDSLWNQVQQEPIGSERYDNVFTAYRWLKRYPLRHRPVIFNRDIPWFW